MTYPTIKMKITPAPRLRGKMDVRFPANVEATAPILLDKSGGTYTFSFDANSLAGAFASAAQGALADSAVQSVVAGSNVTVDNTDPRNPVVSASGGGGGSGDVTGPSSSVDSEIALFNSTTGKVIKRASTTGILKASSGVLSAATAGTDYLVPPSGTALLKANSGGALANAVAGTDYYNPGGTDVAIADGGTGASTAPAARANLGSTTVGDAVFVAANAAAARTAIGSVIGADVQAYDADLAALAANSTSGLWARTGAGTGAARTITGTANQITVTNSDGVSGDPTVSLSAVVVIPSSGSVLSTDPAFVVAKPVTSATVGGSHPFSDNSTYDVSSGSYAAASFDAAPKSIGTFNYDHFAGFQGRIAHQSSGVLTNMYGFVDLPSMNAGTVSNRFGVSVWDVVKSGGALTNNYGVYVKELLEGTTKYAIYTEGSTSSRFNGGIGIGSALQVGSMFSVSGTGAPSAGSAYAMYMNPVITPANGSLGYFGFFAGTVATGASNTISYAVGLFVDTIHKSGSGSVTKAYGIYCGTPDAGGTNYSAYFGGNVTIGSETGSGRLSIAGGKFQLAAAASAYPSFNMPVGGPPTSPSDGDFWFESNANTGLKVRINGVTKTITVS